MLYREIELIIQGGIIMSNIAIVTDSNCSIPEEEAKKEGIHIIPMPFEINQTVYFENQNLSREEFFELLSSGAKIHTSQPAPGDVMNIWDELLTTYDSIVHIPMSSGISGSYQTAKMLSETEYEGKVFVADTGRVSCPMYQSVYDAKHYIEKGFSAKEIAEKLTAAKEDFDIYVTPDDLTYLKNGGRLTPATAAIATALKIKPVLHLQAEQLDASAKVRGMKQARKIMIKSMQESIKTRFAHKNMRVYAAHSTIEEEAKIWQAEIQAAFPDHEILLQPLSWSVSCHVGPGGFGIACAEIIE